MSPTIQTTGIALKIRNPRQYRDMRRAWTMVQSTALIKYEAMSEDSQRLRSNLVTFLHGRSAQAVCVTH